MGNVIQYGIYRVVVGTILCLSIAVTYGQDYFLDVNGVQHNQVIKDWYFNQFTTEEGEELFFTNDVKAVYRDKSEVVYAPFSSFVSDSVYVDFFLPTVQSIRNLETDYFRDEHLEIWVSGDYILYEIKAAKYQKTKDFSTEASTESYADKLTDENLFEAKRENAPIEIPSDVIFIYHDSVGFNKIIAADIEEDYFKLILSKYTFNPGLNDTIFDENFKLKDKNFLDFFDENISALTAVQYSDKDLAEYYIGSLRNEGALIVLLNLDKKKIDLYRNAGNVKLAEALEKDLLESNLSYSLGFTDSSVFNFCKVYVTDAKNRPAILAGESNNIFLGADLKVDSGIVLQEDFFLFARKGQVFETQLEDPDNPKKKTVTSTPVVQEAIVIYDKENVQVMSPFPFFVRETSAGIGAKQKLDKRQKNEKIKQEVSSFDKISDIKSYLEEKYAVENLDNGILSVVLSFDNNFTKFYNSVNKGKVQNFNLFSWRNNSIWQNRSWNTAPSIFLDNRPSLPMDEINRSQEWFNGLPSNF